MEKYHKERLERMELDALAHENNAKFIHDQIEEYKKFMVWWDHLDQDTKDMIEKAKNKGWI